MQSKALFKYITQRHMSKVRPRTVEALNLVLCRGWTVTDAAYIYGLTYQTVSKNCKRYRDLLVQIKETNKLINQREK